MANDAPMNSAAARVAASQALSKNGTIQTPESLAAMIAQMQQGPSGGGDFNPDTMKMIPPQAGAPRPPMNEDDGEDPDADMRQLIKTPPAAPMPNGGGNAAPQIAQGGAPAGVPQLRPNVDPILAQLIARGPNPPHMQDGTDINQKIAMAGHMLPGLRGQVNPNANTGQGATDTVKPGGFAAAGLGTVMAPDAIAEGVPALLRGMLPEAFGGEAAAGADAEGGAAAAGGEAGGNAENALREIVNNPTPENVAQVAKQWPEDVQTLIDNGDISPEAYDGAGLKPTLDSPGYKAWRMFRTKMAKGNGRGAADPSAYLNSISE